MRQSGIIAAAALYALQNNVQRLKLDHQHAKVLAEAVQSTGCLSLDPETVDTNIVIFRVDQAGWDASQFCAAAKESGVWMLPFSRKHVRAVTHLHIREEDATKAGKIIAEVAHNPPRKS
jgi:threonine aldolase